MKITRNARINLFLTGTLFQNNVRELWSLLNLCFRGRFLDMASFDAQFTYPIEKKLNKSCSHEDEVDGARAMKELGE